MSITFIKIAMPLFLTRKIGEFRNKNVFFFMQVKRRYSHGSLPVNENGIKFTLFKAYLPTNIVVSVARKGICTKKRL
jgi:hypothetical protein